MLTTLIVATAVAIIGIAFFLNLVNSENYGKTLENYIIRHNPKNAGDVERLALQFHREQERKFI